MFWKFWKCNFVWFSWEEKFRSVSLRFGYTGNICWAFLFFPVTRGSSLLPLIGLTSESTIKYHIWLGHISNVLFALHTVGFIIYWAITDQVALVISFLFFSFFTLLFSLFWVHQFWLFKSHYGIIFLRKKKWVVFIFCLLNFCLLVF